MMYQKLLVGKKPYFVHASITTPYPMHRHSEFELSYCLSGEYSIIVEGKRYRIREGELAVIKPMASHEFPRDGCGDGRRLVIDFGPLFLGDFYELLLKCSFSDVVYNIKVATSAVRDLTPLLLEIASLFVNKTSFSELSLRGNIYKISALLPGLVNEEEKETLNTKNLQDIAKIERALNIIYEEYRTKIDLEYVSAISGYSKSNFCKVFKDITGDTFHNVLNAHRVEIAKMHLKGTDSSIDAIATEVGFADSKSFCRVFKRVTNLSPGAYRKGTIAT